MRGCGTSLGIQMVMVGSYFWGFGVGFKNPLAGSLWLPSTGRARPVVHPWAKTQALQTWVPTTRHRPTPITCLHDKNVAAGFLASPLPSQKNVDHKSLSMKNTVPISQLSYMQYLSLGVGRCSFLRGKRFGIPPNVPRHSETQAEDLSPGRPRRFARPEPQKLRYCSGPNWIADKELNLSYHNMDM